MAQEAIVLKINGLESFKGFLLAHGITEGTVFSFNYSPSYSGLVSLSIGNRMVSMRKKEFEQIEWEWKK